MQWIWNPFVLLESLIFETLLFKIVKDPWLCCFYSLYRGHKNYNL